MLGSDECNQILVANSFADDSSVVPSSSKHDTLGALSFNSSYHHPLRSQSVLPARRRDTPRIPVVTVIGNEGETQPRTSLSSSDELSTGSGAGEQPIANGAPRNGSEIIIHSVGPNDSFAGVALRYGVSIAALRRANQLWPSDPIHLRTELFIPRGNTLRARPKPTRSASTNTALRSAVEPTPSLSHDLVTSSFAAARNMIISVLPARLSMESLSSRASVSEDHELDDFQMTPTHKMSAARNPFVEEGFELSALAAPHARYKRRGVSMLSRAPYSPANRHLVDNRILPLGDLRSRSISSSSIVSLEQPSRAHPFAVLPVRTSQPEPQPAMELPIRRPRI